MLIECPQMNETAGTRLVHKCHGVDEPNETCDELGVSDSGLRCREAEWMRLRRTQSLTAEHSRGRTHLDWIAQRCTCAMHLQIVHIFWRCIRTTKRRSDDCLLRGTVGSRE